MAAYGGSVQQARRDLADALESLGWVVRESYTPLEAIQLAAIIAKADKLAAEDLPVSVARELLLDTLPACEELVALIGVR